MLKGDQEHPPAASAAAPTERERLGRYALGRSLGRGGMGEVFRARAFGAEGVVKELCVKRIRRERLARPGALEQFVAEARLWMRLHHGNIVPVFDFGRAGAEYYLAMEWVDGADARALLADARVVGDPLPASTAAHVAAEVARALAYAHAVRDEHGRSVVHRDVKPANVLVSRSGDVRLTDFGVAAAGLDAIPRGGTPAYMAPEQRRGEATDARADLYALGVVLHELLAGARPVDGSLALPSTTPQDIAQVVASLLAEEPDARPDSAAAVARSLEAAVGRARARGDEPAPRDELGRRAARVADQHLERADDSAGELAAEASFVDAAPNEPPSITHSTASDAAHAVAERPRPRPTRRHASTRLAGLFIALTVATGALAFYGALRDAPAAQEATRPPSGSGSTAAPPAPSPGPRRDGPRDESAATANAPSPAPSAPAREAERSAESMAHAATATAATARRLEARPSAAPPAARAQAAEPAVLNVNATPWAAVWIDGRSRGTTPLFGESLSPGRHELRFVNAPLGVERETTVTLAPGERRDLVVDLAPARVSAEPPSVMRLAHEK